MVWVQHQDRECISRRLTQQHYAASQTFLPLDLRPKKTRAIRRRLTKEQVLAPPLGSRSSSTCVHQCCDSRKLLCASSMLSVHCLPMYTSAAGALGLLRGSSVCPPRVPAVSSASQQQLEAVAALQCSNSSGKERRPRVQLHTWLGSIGPQLHAARENGGCREAASRLGRVNAVRPWQGLESGGVEHAGQQLTAGPSTWAGRGMLLRTWFWSTLGHLGTGIAGGVDLGLQLRMQRQWAATG
jgi:hypothetical protein